MRLRYDPEAEKKLSASGYLINTFPFKLHPKVVLELGMGKGEMITTLALANPDLFYLGVEKHATVAQKAARKASELEITNLGIICQDVQHIGTFLEGKVKTIWLTFSDPWPKKKHAKRRLTHVAFLKMYKKFLTSEGVIKFKTDNDNFFNWTIQHLKENQVGFQNVTRDLHQSTFAQENVVTGYEKKWSILGQKINYLEITYK